MKGRFDLIEKFKSAGVENCFIFEITLAELKFGVSNSQYKERNALALEKFLKVVNILPIIQALDLYADEKARLRKLGIPISDFDLLIGTTSVAHSMIMITNNTSEFNRITDIDLIDWTKETVESVRGKL
jgi:tRNA(fMet)-specific endonuclease VapC